MSSHLSQSLSLNTEPSFQEDWTRQCRTANDILTRLESQEGVVLADQVGMGKTYVALAVAVSQIQATPDLGQVMVFVPAAVADKWVHEWSKFSQSLLKKNHGSKVIRCVDQPIRSGEDLLRKLSAMPEERKHLLVVTHTALTATLKDGFIQLALLYYATRYIRSGTNVRSGTDLRRLIAKWSTGRNGLIRHAQFTPDRVTKLLETPPSKWLNAWNGLAEPMNALTETPVPGVLIEAVRKLNLSMLSDAIADLPINKTSSIQQRLKKARFALGEAMPLIWKEIFSSIELDLPLLIVDEAHRLKNPKTNISRLFGERTKGSYDGALRGAFRRMLFLTATPFELGHRELIEVLRRMGAVRPFASGSCKPLSERLKMLEDALGQAQQHAIELDEAWQRLAFKDLSVFDAWAPDILPNAGIDVAAREAWLCANRATESRRQMHLALRPWIIRHMRPRRREEHAGAAIAKKGAQGGIPIPLDAALPFLLAARAQSIVFDEVQGKPLFAYGIVSSYQAFQRGSVDATSKVLDSDQDEDDERDGSTMQTKKVLGSDAQSMDNKLPDAAQWYRDEIQQALSIKGIHNVHPKVQATVEKATQLWLAGEKCLIFCWFIKTGEAVEEALKARIKRLLLELAQMALGTEQVDATKKLLNRISDRLFGTGHVSLGELKQRLYDELREAAGGHEDVLKLVVDTAIRNLRMRESLVRYTYLTEELTIDDVWEGIRGKNPSGLIPLERWRMFAKRLAKVRTQGVDSTYEESTDSEFRRIHDALLGSDDEEEKRLGKGSNLKPVRRAYGRTNRATRERLIALFNTPFAPDVLVASSVMGEGIDLHQECRFVIHHDLDWNPSVLEQRTGRLDRIGAYAEREDKNIEVYEPYLEGTHDEKMFRVVKDRAQWFDIVMGRATSVDEGQTDSEEKRVPLHSRIREAFAIDLSSPA